MKASAARVSRANSRIILIAGVLALSADAGAASQCKGMTHDACLSTAQCLWVAGYTRKDGREVTSHCKSKGGRKSPDQARLETPRLGQAR